MSRELLQTETKTRSQSGAYWSPKRMLLWRSQVADVLGVRLITQEQAGGMLGVGRRQIINLEKGGTPIGITVALACNFIRQNAANIIDRRRLDVAAEKAPDNVVDELLAGLRDRELVQELVSDTLDTGTVAVSPGSEGGLKLADLLEGIEATLTTKLQRTTMSIAADPMDQL